MPASAGPVNEVLTRRESHRSVRFQKLFANDPALPRDPPTDPLGGERAAGHRDAARGIKGVSFDDACRDLVWGANLGPPPVQRHGLGEPFHLLPLNARAVRDHRVEPGDDDQRFRR